MPATRLALIAILLLLGPDAARSQQAFPKPIYSELPAYPEKARRAHIVGSVKLRFAVDERGQVTEAEAVSGNPPLRDAALSVVKSWKFRPEDMRANVRYETEFVYDLDAQRSQDGPKLTVSMTDFRRVEVASEIYTPTIE